MFLFNFAVIIINCALKYLKNNKFLSQFSQLMKMEISKIIVVDTFLKFLKDF